MAKAKILIADDSPTHLKLTAEPLIEKGYEVITAADGEEAIQKAESEKPAAILLDVVMPKMNGFQVCRKIKTSPQLKQIKVIMLTSKTQESDKFWGEKQGADAYLTKPCTTDEILATLEKTLR